MSKLSDVALSRAKAGTGEQTPGFCQRWVRQCCQAVYGAKYDRYWQASAKDTAVMFLKHPPEGAVVLETGDVKRTRLGDLLYARTGHGGYGHVAVRVLGNRIAENSVVHHGDHGAIGLRPLADFSFDLVVRLQA